MKEPLKIKTPPTREQQTLLFLLDHEVSVMHALMDMTTAMTGEAAQDIRANTTRLEGIDIARLRVSALEQRVMKLEAQRK